MFHQTFQPHDLLVVLLLVVLEGVLSIDNALVLGLLARRLRPELRNKALTYGLFGALIFRLLAVAIAGKLLQWDIVKLLGGGYLVYVAIKDLFFSKEQPNEGIAIGADGLPVAVDETSGKPLTEDELGAEIVKRTHGVNVDYESIVSTHSRAFWYAVAVIELTDIAFAIDSILAAIALVGPPPPGTPEDALHPKLWVVVTGGMLGVLLMRYAAVIFIRLLEKFPRFEVSAYLLVLVIGLKLVADWYFNLETQQLNFHDAGSAAFWIFWFLMAICFAVGFIPRRRSTT